VGFEGVGTGVGEVERHSGWAFWELRIWWMVELE